jgi:hypothetical protein
MLPVGRLPAFSAFDHETEKVLVACAEAIASLWK